MTDYRYNDIVTIQGRVIDTNARNARVQIRIQGCGNVWLDDNDDNLKLVERPTPPEPSRDCILRDKTGVLVTWVGGSFDDIGWKRHSGASDVRYRWDTLNRDFGPFDVFTPSSNVGG